MIKSLIKYKICFTGFLYSKIWIELLGLPDIYKKTMHKFVCKKCCNLKPEVKKF